MARLGRYVGRIICNTVDVNAALLEYNSSQESQDESLKTFQ
jgi:hypothetical protein